MYSCLLSFPHHERLILVFCCSSVLLSPAVHAERSMADAKTGSISLNFKLRTMPQAWCPHDDAPAASSKDLKVFAFKLRTMPQAWCPHDDAPAASSKDLKVFAFKLLNLRFFNGRIIPGNLVLTCLLGNIKGLVGFTV